MKQKFPPAESAFMDENTAGLKPAPTFTPSSATVDADGKEEGALSCGPFAEARKERRVAWGKASFWLLCFVVPIVMLCAVAAASGVYPFGEQSFLTEDLKYQYVDFYRWFSRVLRGEESIFYCASCGLGANAWGLYSYYLASPLNLMLPLFGEDRVTLFVFVSDALRLGFMQLSAVFYLRRRFGLGRASSFSLALGYTWSMWVATNLRNPMWLDALVLLPLIMWAVWQLAERGRWLPLALLMTADVIVCWYTAFMTVLFCVLFALLERACGKKRCSVPRLALRFARPMVVALLLSAWTFVPTVKAMLGSGGSEGVGFLGILAKIVSADSSESFWEALVTARPLNLLRGLVPALYNPIHAIPQFYCGVLLLACFVAFFASRRVSRAAKRAAGILVVVMLASIILKPLQAIWCGFRQPSGFFSRPCIFVAPTMMWMAAFWWSSVRSDGSSTLGRLDSVSLRLAGKKGVSAAIALLAVVDLAAGAWLTWRTMYVDYPQDYNDAYYQESEAQVAWLKENDSGTWRMERTYVRAGKAALNEAMGCDYLGISSYSSAHNQSALDFLGALGYTKKGLMHARYAKSVLASDALLGVKYTSSGYGHAGLAEVAGAPTVDGTGVYENPYALSLGYAVADTAVGAELTGENPFERQNSLASALVGHEVQLFKRADATLVTDASDQKTWQVSVPAGALGYAYVESMDDRGQVVSLTVDDSRTEDEGWRFQYSIRPFGAVEGEAGGVHTVTISAVSNSYWCSGLASADCDLYYLDLDALEEVTSELSAHELSFESFGGKGIDATVEAASDGWVMVSVPHEDGWTVTVNGEEVQTAQAFGDALTLVPVKSGSNTIQMRFVSPGFYAGCAISAVSVVGLLGWSAVARRRAVRGAGLGRSAGAAAGV